MTTTEKNAFPAPSPENEGDDASESSQAPEALETPTPSTTTRPWIKNS